MAIPDQPTDIESIRMWIAEHDGRIEAWWVQQREWNNRMEERMETLTHRVSSVEKRMMWIAGAFAAIGSLAGQLLTGGLG